VPKPYVPPVGPFWIISSSQDGTMTWSVPYTGEVIHGKADGQSRPITGPQIPPGITFVWKRISTNRLEFYASKDGRLVERAVTITTSASASFTKSSACRLGAGSLRAGLPAQTVSAYERLATPGAASGLGRMREARPNAGRKNDSLDKCAHLCSCYRPS